MDSKAHSTAPRESTPNIHEDEPIIVVRRQWNDWRLATYRLSDVNGFHWTNISGGVRAPAPRPFIHAYVWCNAMISGELAHTCEHGEGPHEIKVCVTKKDNTKAVYEKVRALADAAGYR